MVIAIVFSCIFFLLGIVLIPLRIIAAPACSFLGLLIMSMGKTHEGYPLFPLDSSIILGWLFTVVLVTIATLCQPAPVRNTRKGIGYFLVGALTGMAIGLLGFTVSSNLGENYAIMCICADVGTFLGFLTFTRTPSGKNVAPGSGNFFTYLMAKGFPTAVSVMQTGLILVLLIGMR